jgi:hypothetical protein
MMRDAGVLRAVVQGVSRLQPLPPKASKYESGKATIVKRESARYQTKRRHLRVRGPRGDERGKGEWKTAAAEGQDARASAA